MFHSRRITMGGDVFRDEYSLEFDKSNDYIEWSDVDALDMASDSFSVLCWMKTSTASGNSFVVQKYGGSGAGWTLRYHGSNNNIYAGIHDADTDITLAGSSALQDDRWYHLAVVQNKSDNTWKIYVNGGQSSSVDSTDIGSVSNSSAFRVGADHSPSNYVGGKVSDLAFYDTALSTSQIKTIYNGREPYDSKGGILSGNLIGWWRMGDGLESGAGTTIYDMSDNSNNGTMTNMEAVDFTGDRP